MGQGGFSDFMSFRTLISTAWIKVVYAVGAIVITIASLGTLVAGSRQFGGAGVLIGLVSLVAGNILWRMICEAAILFFSMHEQLVTLAQLASGRTRVPSGESSTGAMPVVGSVSTPHTPTATSDGATVECRWCGERTSAIGKSCRFCGRPLQPGTPPGGKSGQQGENSPGDAPSAFCPSCGAELPSGTIHHRCWKCDAPLH